nr:MAG TPA: hypothetical protein [Caudoviricetes sp.]
MVNESGQKVVKFVMTIIRDFCENEVKTVILRCFWAIFVRFRFFVMTFWSKAHFFSIIK